MPGKCTGDTGRTSRPSSSPYVWLFKSAGRDYVLDHHSNRVFALSLREAECFRLWLQGDDVPSLSSNYGPEWAEIQRLRETGLFCCAPPEGLAYGAEWDEIEAMILKRRSQTILELTQRCNLRCGYCTFGGGFRDHRTHSSKTMSIETLERALLAAVEQGKELQSIGIGFYGGEPLLCFDLLRHAVDFIRHHAGGTHVRFSLTTNATLIDQTIASFLRDNDFGILVSIDGPQTLHDRYRVTAKGKGSYRRAIAGLRKLIDSYGPEKHSRIGLNMVIPAIGWVRQLDGLWEQEPWLPKDIRAQAAVADLPEGFAVPPVPDGAQWKDIEDDWTRATSAGYVDSSSLRNELFERQYAKIHQRPVFPGARTHFFPNGCCIPAVRKVCVTAGGQYLVCERAHGCPPLGHVRTGVDLDRVKRLVDEYAENSIAGCRNCLAATNCSLCFHHSYEAGEFNAARKRAFCEGERHAFTHTFAEYCRLRQEHPEHVPRWEAVEFL